MVLDFGGVYDGYCVDLSRTVELGDAGADFRRLFAAVAEAQQAAIGAVRPGVKASTVDAAAREIGMDPVELRTAPGMGLASKCTRSHESGARWQDNPI